MGWLLLGDKLEGFVGYANNGAITAIWTEEYPEVAGLREIATRGLYIVSQGPASETALAIRAVRSEYFSSATDAAAEDQPTLLRAAVNAAHQLLLPQARIGVSGVFASVVGDVLSIAYVGECRGYLYSDLQGTLEALTEESRVAHTLGGQDTVFIGQAQHLLSEGDVLVLCSGTVAEATSRGEIAIMASAAVTGDPQEVARRLIARARRGQGAAIVVSLHRSEAVITSPSPEPQLSLPVEPEAAPEPAIASRSGSRLRELRASPAGGPLPSARETPSGARPRKGIATGSILRRAAITVASLAVFWLMFQLGGRLVPWLSSLPPLGPNIGPITLPFAPEPTASLAPLPSISDLSAPTSPTPMPSPVALSDVESLWRRIESLTIQGDRGDIAALRELVASLERLQALSPTDPKIDDRLRAARISLVFHQRLQEVAAYWGSGETSAGTTGAWSHIVELLEPLYAQALKEFPQLYREQLKDKLYTAHVNYGLALHAAGRLLEAKGQYQRASQIDPTRPEASAALIKLP